MPGLKSWTWLVPTAPLNRSIQMKAKVPWWVRPYSPTHRPSIYPLSTWKFSRLVAPVASSVAVPAPVTRQIPTIPLKSVICEGSLIGPGPSTGTGGKWWIGIPKGATPPEIGSGKTVATPSKSALASCGSHAPAVAGDCGVPAFLFGGRSNAALTVRIRPHLFKPWVTSFAVGEDGHYVSGLFACPNPEHLLVAAGIDAYLIQVRRPRHADDLPI